MRSIESYQSSNHVAAEIDFHDDPAPKKNLSEISPIRSGQSINANSGHDARDGADDLCDGKDLVPSVIRPFKISSDPRKGVTAKIQENIADQLGPENHLYTTELTREFAGIHSAS
jgi:hypothetical protein